MLACGGGTARAQGIIYGTPQQPIYYSAGVIDSTTDIDINGDGTPDFAIVSTSGIGAEIAPLGNNSIIAIPESPPNLDYFVAALNQGTSIGSSLDPIPDAQWFNNQTSGVFNYAWIGTMVTFDQQGVVNGYFAGQASAYVGFDLVDDGQNYYGWIQLSNPLNLVYGQVLDWAYESSPNTSIFAGEGAPTPEPSTWALLATGVALITARQKFVR